MPADGTAKVEITTFDPDEMVLIRHALFLAEEMLRYKALELSNELERYQKLDRADHVEALEDMERNAWRTADEMLVLYRRLLESVGAG